VNQRKFIKGGHSGERLRTTDLSGRTPGKRARSAQRFTFINNFKDLCKNSGKSWETARNSTQWKNIVHRGLDQP